MYDEIFEILNKAKAFGNETNERAQLYGRTPHIAPQAWFHWTFTGLTEVEIKELEEKLPFKIPVPYREFLNRYNGMYLFSGSIALSGYRKNYSRTGLDIYQPFDLYLSNVLERQVDAEESYFYFGSYNWDGSKVYIDNESLQVYRCLRGSSVPVNQWISFEEFLTQEVKRLDTHFDGMGHEIDEDRPTTPPGTNDKSYGL